MAAVTAAAVATAAAVELLLQLRQLQYRKGASVAPDWVLRYENFNDEVSPTSGTEPRGDRGHKNGADRTRRERERERARESEREGERESERERERGREKGRGREREGERERESEREKAAEARAHWACGRAGPFRGTQRMENDPANQARSRCFSQIASNNQSQACSKQSRSSPRGGGGSSQKTDGARSPRGRPEPASDAPTSPSPPLRP